VPTPDSSLPRPHGTARIADLDREAAAERLRTAVADGELELSELEDRLSAVYAARTVADLEAVTADLVAPYQAADSELVLRTRSGTIKRVGYWVAPSQIVAECTSGTIKLDFTTAECRHREVAVRAQATSGSVVLIVPVGWNVVMDDVSSTSGSVVNRVGYRPGRSATVLRVTGQVKSGSIKARHPRRSFWDWLLRRPHRPERDIG
jgi:hypothetical protein